MHNPKKTNDFPRMASGLLPKCFSRKEPSKKTLREIPIEKG